MSQWRVFLVEDDPSSREYFADAVRQDARLVLAGAARSVGEALDWLATPHDRLDVLLTDLGLPDGSGLEIIKRFLQADPRCEALVISMFGDEDHVLASIEAGAVGYIHKDSAPADIAAVIVEMKQGGSPISPMIARRLLARFRRNPEPARVVDVDARPGGSPPVLLTPREQEVLELIARGFSYADIARLKGIKFNTVQTHIKHLYSKLAVKSRGEAVFEASHMGLLGKMPSR